MWQQEQRVQVAQAANKLALASTIDTAGCVGRPIEVRTC
jgi:hypothetical protein